MRNKLDAAGFYTWADIDLLYTEWIRSGRAQMHTAVLSRLYPAQQHWQDAWRRANIDGEDAEAPVDVSGVVLTHFRLEKLREQSLDLGWRRPGLEGNDRGRHGQAAREGTRVR